MIPGLPCDKTGALPRLVHWTGQPEPLPGRAFHRLPYNGGEHHPPPCRHQKLKWENKQKSEVLQKHYQNNDTPSHIDPDPETIPRHTFAMTIVPHHNINIHNIK